MIVNIKKNLKNYMVLKTQYDDLNKRYGRILIQYEFLREESMKNTSRMRAIEKQLEEAQGSHKDTMSMKDLDNDAQSSVTIDYAGKYAMLQAKNSELNKTCKQLQNYADRVQPVYNAVTNAVRAYHDQATEVDHMAQNNVLVSAVLQAVSPGTTPPLYSLAIDHASSNASSMEKGEGIPNKVTSKRFFNSDFIKGSTCMFSIGLAALSAYSYRDRISDLATQFFGWYK